MRRRFGNWVGKNMDTLYLFIYLFIYGVEEKGWFELKDNLINKNWEFGVRNINWFILFLFKILFINLKIIAEN